MCSLCLPKSLRSSVSEVTRRHNGRRHLLFFKISAERTATKSLWEVEEEYKEQEEEKEEEEEHHTLFSLRKLKFACPQRGAWSRMLSEVGILGQEPGGALIIKSFQSCGELYVQCQLFPLFSEFLLCHPAGRSYWWWLICRWQHKQREKCDTVRSWHQIPTSERKGMRN